MERERESFFLPNTALETNKRKNTTQFLNMRFLKLISFYIKPAYQIENPFSLFDERLSFTSQFMFIFRFEIYFLSLRGLRWGGGGGGLERERKRERREERRRREKKKKESEREKRATLVVPIVIQAR